METGNLASQKVSFKVFSNEQKAKMQTKYPFLSKSQINKRIKDLWKKLDTAEKSCYTKTIISPPKNKRAKKVKKPLNKQKPRETNSQNYHLKEDDRHGKVKHKTGDKTTSNLEQQCPAKTEKQFPENNDNCSNQILENKDSAIEGPKENRKSSRKTVPWKGRPSLGKSDLWSDSSSPERTRGKKAKQAKKQEKVQGILKPSGDASRQLKTKNRVSFGSPHNNILPTTPSPGNFGDNNTPSSDEDDDSGKFLHRSDEDMYDFERIDRHDLCVEEEDMYAPMFKQNSETVQHLAQNDNPQTAEYNESFKIPKNVISKRKGKKEEKFYSHMDIGENLLSPLTEEESSQNSLADISTPTVKVQSILVESLITPQMNESLVQQKLEVKKAPHKSKLTSPKTSTNRHESTRKSTRRSISTVADKKPDEDKDISDSDSLSITPLSESLPSENESLASQSSQEDLKITSGAFCKKKQKQESANSLAELECIAENSMKKVDIQKRKRRSQTLDTEIRLQDLNSASSPSKSASSLKEIKKKRQKMSHLSKKGQTNRKCLSLTKKQARGSMKEQEGVEQNRSPKPSKKPKKVKSPIGRMDADQLISESPKKTDCNKISSLLEPCLYFNEDLSNDSDSSQPFVDDRKQTKKVLMSAILGMQQAVRCQDMTTDAESSSPSLSGISEPASLSSENDNFMDTQGGEEERGDIKDPEANEEEEGNVERFCEKFPDINSQNIINCSQAESAGSIGSISDNSQEGVNFQLPAQETKPKKTEEIDSQQMEIPIMDQQSEKKLDLIEISSEQVITMDEEKDVFQMFTKPSSSTETNIQTRRFISSAHQESRSNFTDLFHEDDIF